MVYKSGIILFCLLFGLIILERVGIIANWRADFQAALLVFAALGSLIAVEKLDRIEKEIKRLGDKQ